MYIGRTARFIFMQTTQLYFVSGVFNCKQLLNLTEAEIRRTFDVNTIAIFWVKMTSYGRVKFTFLFVTRDYIDAQ